MPTAYHIGTSGFSYEHWRGRFYPQELSQAKWLDYYTRHFATVELNSSFYRLPSEKAFVHWRESSPPGFTYAVKVSRLITHLKKLRNVEEALETFLSRAQLLGEKLGPLLYQLPPGMPRNDAALESFLKLLPTGLRHAFEFRNESWLQAGIMDLLRRYNAGFCVFDMPGLTTPLAATADFAYIRFHGSSGLYSSCYSPQELAEWAKRTAELGRGLKAVYIYFNNDAEAFAVRNALALRQQLAAISQNEVRR